MTAKNPLSIRHHSVYDDDFQNTFLLCRRLRCLFLLCAFLVPNVLFAGDKPPKIWKNQPRSPLDELYFAEQSNPATKALISQHFVELAVNNSYFLKELMDKALFAQVCYRENRFVLAAFHSGYSKYGELKLTAGYSKVWAHRFSLTTHFHYWLNHVEKRPSVHSFSFDLAFHAAINSKIGFGVEVDNPAHLKYGVVGRSPLPLLISAHLYYKIGTRTLLATRVEKMVNGRFNMSLLFLQQFNSMHFTVAPSLLDTEIGVGVRFSCFLLSYHAGYNYKLGTIMRLNVNIYLKKSSQ
jgi:hypothetical protein